MRMILTALFALWTLAACASSDSAQQTSATSNDCFRSEEVRGFNVIDNTHIGFRVGANRNYILTTMWNARDLDWTQAIGIRSSTGRICTGNGLGVELIGGEPRRTYPIVSIERAPGDETVEGS
jgi:Family of unknown function (DUF6491)